MKARRPLETSALVALAGLVVLLVPRSAHAGYTHYLRWHGTPDRVALDAALVEMEKLADAKRDILADREARTGRDAVFRGPMAFADAGDFPGIAFNGIGEASHEAFGFPLALFADNPSFSFVKTAYKPYDEVVVACLVVAHDHFPQGALEITSDGAWRPDFVAGALLYEKVLGRSAHDPLTYPTGATRAPEDPSETPGDGATPRGSLFRWLLLGAFVAVFFGVVYSFRPRH